jgi:hypothetical protein
VNKPWDIRKPVDKYNTPDIRESSRVENAAIFFFDRDREQRVSQMNRQLLFLELFLSTSSAITVGGWGLGLLRDE